MLKKAVFLSIIFLQFLRLASAMPALDIESGTSLNFSAAMTVVNQGLLAQLHPLKTLAKVSSRMADTGSPFQPTHNENRQRPIETTLIVSSSPELVKTNMPFWPGSGVALFLSVFIVFLFRVARRDGLVLCRIQHLFSRAREGICAAVMQASFFLRKSPLIPQKINGDFLFYTFTISR
jgi:hypothetical protein